MSDYVQSGTNICIRGQLGVTGLGRNGYASSLQSILSILLHEMSIVSQLNLGNQLSGSEKDYRVVKRCWHDIYDTTFL